jgi:heat shock protein HtpX
MMPQQAVLARHHRRNQVQTVLVLAGIGGWMAVVGWLLAGAEGVAWALLGTLGVVLLLPPLRSAAVLRAMFGAVPLTAAEAPGLTRLVAYLAERAGLHTPPPLLFIPRAELVALSTGGGDDAAIAVSAGLLETLPPRELAAVLAHETSHLRHGDMRILRLAEAASRLTRTLSLFGLLTVIFYLPAALMAGGSLPLLPLLLLLTAPVASDLLTMKLSRTREYEADAGAVDLTGDPRGLMTALERIERLQGGTWERLMRGPAWLSLIRTHPATDERLRRLEEMVPEPSAAWAALLDLVPAPSRIHLRPSPPIRRPGGWFGR